MDDRCPCSNHRSILPLDSEGSCRDVTPLEKIDITLTCKILKSDWLKALITLDYKCIHKLRFYSSQSFLIDKEIVGKPYILN